MNRKELQADIKKLNERIDKIKEDYTTRLYVLENPAIAKPHEEVKVKKDPVKGNDHTMTHPGYEGAAKILRIELKQRDVGWYFSKRVERQYEFLLKTKDSEYITHEWHSDFIKIVQK